MQLSEVSHMLVSRTTLFLGLSYRAADFGNEELVRRFMSEAIKAAHDESAEGHLN